MPGLKPRVMIADYEDHGRQTMKDIIVSMNCDVVGEAKNGIETVELFKKLKPHLLLLDINMPMKSGEELLREIFTASPNAFVIVLTMMTDVEVMEKCIMMGASNYLLKNTPIPEIKALIKETWQMYLRNRSSRK